ncbi:MULTISPECIES: DUF488 domain-containing protein [Phenylobacterium]|uniref:Uncharacterized protein YeaO (DUF488 family) n=1 Tax=Phenylobacterium koreense TaxID=266125 RepID=A0ABV2EGL7_9CAUL
MSVKIKRIYEPSDKADGLRVLVDRLWPRGVRKADAHVDVWLREVAPSDELRRWFGHEPERWDEFRVRYGAELDGNAAFAELRGLARGPTTLLYSAKDEAHNQAVVLAERLKAG